MVRTIIISTMIVGIGGLGVLPSMAGFSAPSQIELSFGSIDSRNTALRLDLWKEHSFGSHRFFVQRESTRPPGESHSGRVSGSPPGGITGSKRDSGRPTDLTEGNSTLDNLSEEQKAPKKSDISTEKDRDPTKGGGDTTSGFDRRGGAR